MKITRTLTTTSIFALFAGPALADLTAEDVLADQLSQVRIYGLDAQTTGQSKSGDTLTVNGMVATAEVPEGTMSFTIGGMELVEQGDGTVRMVYPDEMPIAITGTMDGEDFGLEMVLRQSGTENIVSGTPENIRYDFSSSNMTIGDVRFSAPEEAMEMDMNMEISMSGLAGFMALGSGTVRDYEIDFASQAMNAVIAFAEPGGEGSFNLTFDVADLAAAYSGKLAQQELMGSFAQSIQAGNATNGTATIGATNYTFAGSGPEGAFEGSMSSAGSDFDFAMGPQGIDYSTTSRDISLTFGGDAIPFPPMTFKMAETGGRFALPVVPGEDPQDFAIGLSFVGLELDQMLWGMFDPAGQLPRDPATVIVDLSGEVVLTQDIFDPANAEMMMMAPPGQINGLDINKVEVTVAGAQLTADGAFTFNNEMGIPMPAGTANLMLTGGNALLDTLVGMGLVPEDQAMGARMMMGMFAIPGDGPDTLVSTIEVKEDGAVLANGQRIR